MKLLDVQEEAAKSLSNLLKTEKEIELVGKPGTGRRHIVKLEFQTDYYILDIIQENENGTDSLVPLKNAILKFEENLNKTKLKVLFSLGYGGVSVSTSKESNKLFEEKTAIIKTIKKLGKLANKHKKSGVIILLKKNECNSIIKKVLEELKEEKNIHIVWLVERKTNNVKFVEVLPVSASSKTKKHILIDLGLPYENADKLDEKEINFIFKIANDNINKLNRIIDGLQKNAINFKNDNDSEKIISQFLQEYDLYDENIKQEMLRLLKFCARILHHDDSATIPKLAFLMKMEINQVKDYVEQTKNLEIINENNMNIQFTIELIKNIFILLSEPERINIYNMLVDMVSKMQPSNYKLKHIYADMANNNDSILYIIQYYMQEIRKNRAVNIKDLSINEEYKNILMEYRQMWQYMNCQRYDDVADVTSKLNNTHFILLGEFKLLYAQALMKSLDEDKRNKALLTIKSIYNDKLDGDLKYRIKMCYMSALVHMGKYDEAHNIYVEVYQELISEIDKHHSDELSRNLNILLRKNNMLYDYQSAEGCIEKSKEFFKNRFDDFTDYFFAIANSLGIHLKNMHLEKAAKDIEDFENLRLEHIGVTFKREYIYHINQLVYQYFSAPTKQTAQHVAEEFHKMLCVRQDMHGDDFLVANNYATFTALSGDVQKALDYLVSIEPKDLDDKEGIYIYKYKVNRAVFEYILNNSKKDELVEMLNKISFPTSYPNRKVMKKEVEYIVNAMKNGVCKSMDDWLNQYYEKVPHNRPTNGYEQGLVITTVFNWDDD